MREALNILERSAVLSKDDENDDNSINNRNNGKNDNNDVGRGGEDIIIIRGYHP